MGLKECSQVDDEFLPEGESQNAFQLHSGLLLRVCH
jgi:hypothetical protein